MPFDVHHLMLLERDECVRLLASSSLGRIAITSGALPVVLPVNFRLVGDRIVFRTGRGTKLDAATANAIVAFEVDHVDALSHAGWSVVVTGEARQVTDPDELTELAAAGIPRWAQSAEDVVVAIDLAMVSGRRLGLDP